MNTSTKRGVLAAAGTMSLLAGVVAAKAAPAAPTALAAGSANGTKSATKSTSASSTSSAKASSPAARAAAPASAAASASATTASQPGTYTGDPVDVGYGTVQVSVVMTGGRISDVKALQLPSDRSRSRSLSDYAAPVLRTETLKAQGANIDGVSGATYTSEGYAESLQSAIDKARA